MEAPKPNKLKNSLIFGALTGGTLILLSVVLFSTNKYGSGLQYIGYLILAAGIVVGTLNYREKMAGGFISYGQSMGSGTLISLFAGILLGFFTVIYIKFLNPGFVEEMMGKIQAQWESQGMKEEQIAMAEKYARMMFTPVMMFIISIIGYVFWGVIISLIASIFLKNERPPFDPNVTDQPLN